MALVYQAKTALEGSLTPMAEVTPITEQFQHFLAEMKESFWGDLYGRTQQESKGERAQRNCALQGTTGWSAEVL